MVMDAVRCEYFQPTNKHLPLNDVTKHDVLAVEPLGFDRADEKLRAVGVGAGIGHGEDARTSVL